MDDVLKRLSNVESCVSDVRSQLSGLSAMASHMATKSDVSGLSTMASHMATKADVSQLESSLIKWLVGTLLAVAVLTFTIARFVKVGG